MPLSGVNGRGGSLPPPPLLRPDGEKSPDLDRDDRDPAPIRPIGQPWRVRIGRRIPEHRIDPRHDAHGVKQDLVWHEGSPIREKAPAAYRRAGRAPIATIFFFFPRPRKGGECSPCLRGEIRVAKPRARPSPAASCEAVTKSGYNLFLWGNRPIWPRWPAVMSSYGRIS